MKFFLSILLAIVMIFGCSNKKEDEKTKDPAEIHAAVYTLDSHCDTPIDLVRSDHDLSVRHDPKESGTKVDIPRMEEGGMDGMFFVVWTAQGPTDEEGYKKVYAKTETIFASIEKAIEDNKNKIGRALTPDDAYKLEKEGKRAIFLGMENGYPVGEDISRVSEFYNRGIRYITLAHTSNNQICDSSNDPEGPDYNGLSSFGEEVVKEMNKIGMMVDVSHVSDSTFFDVIKLSEAPVIASHSCASALCENPRNLTDDQLRAIKENNGVVQVCIFSEYLRDIEQDPRRDSARQAIRAEYNNFDGLSDEEMRKARSEWREVNEKYPPKLATVEDVADHIDHIVKVAGIDHVGIGTDFDGGGGISGVYDVSEIPNITRELVKRGYTKDQIEKIWSGNLFRVFNDVLAKAEKS